MADKTKTTTMKYAKDITELIGNTPMVRLNRAIHSGSNLVLAKLEQFNPGASLKDRSALYMIEDAERKRLISSGSIIIEATSGNTGLALAIIAAVRRYRVIITMPDSIGADKQDLLQTFGVQVELTPAHLGMKGAIEKAKEIHANIKGSFMVTQFDNPSNPMAHELMTGREIIDDTCGKVDYLIAGVGTGGTLTGAGKVLKGKNPQAKIIAVEPKTCAVLNGNEAAPHKIQGTGAGFIPSNLDVSLIDDVVAVSDTDAFRAMKRLMMEEGIMAGVSSGAVLAAASIYLKSNNVESSTVVLIFPDTGERYGTIIRSKQFKQPV
jgi:cysteine synthase A